MSIDHPATAPQVFETRDVIALVGIPPVYLNKFVERKMFGIAPRLRAGGGRGSRRWFDAADVYAIALVWWLFQSGLRSQVIQRVLATISVEHQSNAYGAMVAVLQHYKSSGTEQVLAISRQLVKLGRKSSGQVTALLRRSEVPNWFKPGSSVLMIPTGEFVGSLVRAVERGRKEN